MKIAVKGILLLVLETKETIYADRENTNTNLCNVLTAAKYEEGNNIDCSNFSKAQNKQIEDTQTKFISCSDEIHIEEFHDAELIIVDEVV